LNSLPPEERKATIFDLAPFSLGRKGWDRGINKNILITLHI